MAKVHQDCSFALRELLLVTNLPRYFQVSFPRKTEGGPKGTPSSNYSHIGLRPGKSESESGSVVSDSLWPQGPYSPWNSPGQNTGVGSISLLQGIFPTQESNPGLLHCRWILYQLSHKGSPRTLEWVAYPFSSGSSRPRNWTRVSCIAGEFFTNWAIKEVNVNYFLFVKN